MATPEEQKDLFHRLRTGTMRRRDFVKLTGSVTAGLAMSSILGACGDDGDEDGGDTGADPDAGAEDDEEDESATEEEDEPAGETPEVEVDESAAELIVGITPDPVNMSPWLPNSMPGYSIHYHMYEPTIFRDENMELIGGLAESWEQVEPDVMQLTLRQGIRFHNGEELTSAAVKFSYEKILDETHGALWRPMLSMISEIETPDDYTVLLHTHEPNRALVRNLTLAGIMTESIFNEIDPDWASNAIGTGPFKFVEFQPGNQVVLERNDDYWGEAPALQRITYRIITETGTRLSSLQSGDVQVVNNVPPDQSDQIDQDENLQILSTPTARIVYAGFRCDRAPFDDVRVRQAVNYAINKEEIVSGLFGGMTEAATGPLAPMVFAANNELGPWPYDPDRARELLEEAGNPNPTVIFGCANGRYINDRQVGEAIAGYMTEVGFEVDFRAPEWGDYQAEVYLNEESEYDMHLLAWGVINMEPDYQMRDHYHPDFAERTGYQNQEVGELLDEAAATVDDEEEATRILHEAQAIVWEECPWAWLYYQPEIHGASTRLTNYGPRPDEYILFAPAQLEEA